MFTNEIYASECSMKYECLRFYTHQKRCFVGRRGERVRDADRFPDKRQTCGSYRNGFN